MTRHQLKPVPRGYMTSSSALCIKSSVVDTYQPAAGRPRIGDVMYCRIRALGAHRELENRNGRIHRLTDSTTGLFVYGNRYATDGFEARIPDEPVAVADMIARSGVIGTVRVRNSRLRAPTTVDVLGQVHDPDGQPLNTLDHSLVTPKNREKKSPRSKLILVCGTAMNSGKSTAAVATCWALTTMGHSVRASKVTGTASLKEILHMSDAGATSVSDFSYLGYPSTYLLGEPEVRGIFDNLDLKFGNNPRNYWIVEVADGLLQRETAMLLANPEVRARIHRLILCAGDAFGAIGALHVLDETYQLRPDAISGIIASSPLGVQELQEYTNVPAFDASQPDLHTLSNILIGD